MKTRSERAKTAANNVSLINIDPSAVQINTSTTNNRKRKIDQISASLTSNQNIIA